MGRGFREQQNQGVASKPGGLPAPRSLGPIHQGKNSSVTRGISFQGAQDYGKVINLALLHPPTPYIQQPAPRWLPALSLSLFYCILLSPLSLQVKHRGGRNTNKVVSYSFFKAFYILPARVCTCVCVCAGAFSVGRSGFLCSRNRTRFYIKGWINLDYHLMNIGDSNCIFLGIRGG